jgi:hypothetical protein
MPAGEAPPWGTDAMAFQYWPESLADSRSSDWSPRAIPGGSHPIYQWTHGGERTLAFTAIFTTDTSPGDDFGVHEKRVNELFGALGGDAYEVAKTQPLNGLQIGVRDIDLRTIVAWLRWFTYPTYGTASSGSRVFEPAKCQLVMPNTGLGYDGEDFVVCIMRSCQVTYSAWFPSGLPRIIEVQLEFAEVVQSGQRVRFHDRQRMGRAAFVKDYQG